MSTDGTEFIHDFTQDTSITEFYNKLQRENKQLKENLKMLSDNIASNIDKNKRLIKENEKDKEHIKRLCKKLLNCTKNKIELKEIALILLDGYEEYAKYYKNINGMCLSKEHGEIYNNAKSKIESIG